MSMKGTSVRWLLWELFKVFAVIILVVILFLAFLQGSEQERVERDQRALACQGPASVGDRYADPISRTCGVQQRRSDLRGQIIVYPGTREACWEILKDARFSPVRHCWKEILAPAAK